MHRYLFSIFLCLTGFTVQQEQNLLTWKPTRRLQWNDFKGRPDVGSENAALTSTHIKFQYTIGENNFSFQVSCQFNKSQSWTRVKTESVLAHEQAHFDLAELYARKLRQAVSNYKFKAGSTEQDLDSLYDALMKEHHAVQQHYDSETDHSRNREQQQQWLRKINESLMVPAELASIHP